MVPHTGPETAGPIDRDERLGEAIEAYLERAERGGPTDPEEFAKGYPDLGDDLVAALEGLALVQGLVGEATGPGHRLEEGRRVAGYRIVRELGRGGMGIVYEAVHVGLDRPVALKVLGTQAAPDSSGRRRFLNEAKTAAGLHHTHIVPVFDVGQVGGLCYYAMQRIEGSGLDRVLRAMRRDRSVAAGSTLGSGSRKTGAPPAPRSKPNLDAALVASGLGDETLTWGDVGGGSSWRRREPVDDPPTFTPPRGSAYYRWVADVGRQAAEALAHAHQRGVIHRDIKPSNLLVDGRGMIWVADFGLARRLADPSQTQFDSLLGTPRYMSPEQARTGAIDGRADVYSLGATLYELITLRPPFDGQSAAELIEQIKGREPFRPRKFDPRVPLDLETILLKALAKRPDDRYATADALAEDLARFLAHEPVRARRIGPVGRLVRFARRHPSLTAVSTTAAALVLSTATFAYLRVLDERDRADDAAVAAKKAQRETEAANRDLKVKDRQIRETMLKLVEKTAIAVRLSSDPNRRSTGLGLLHDAATMGPDPTLRVKLRDQAVSFLTMRDVEARPPISTADKPQHGLIFSPDGKKIATLADDGELGIWDVEGRRLVDSTRMPVAPPRRTTNGSNRGRDWFVPSTSRMAAAGEQVAVVRRDGGLRLFNIAAPNTPADVLAMNGFQITSLVSTPDGRYFATPVRPFPAPPDRQGPRAEPEEIRIFVWDRESPEAPKSTLTMPAPRPEQASPRDRPGPPWMAIAPDGSRIAATRPGDSEVALWDDAGVPLPSIDAQGNIKSLTLGPAGLLAVALEGSEVALWDLSPRKPKPLPGLSLHQSFASQLRFSPRDGSILAVAGSGTGIELWDLTTHTLLAILPTRNHVEDLAFSPDGRTLAAGQASSIALWSVVEPTALDVLPETGDPTMSLAFGPDDVLAIASLTNWTTAPIRLWGGPGRCPPSVQAWDQVRPTSVGFDDRGRLLTLEPDALRWFLPTSPEPVARLALPSIEGEPSDDRRRPGPGPQRKGEGPPPSRPGALMVARSPDGRSLLLSRQGTFLTWRADDPDTFTRLDRSVEIDKAGPRWPAVLGPRGDRLYHLSRHGGELAARDLRGGRAGKAAWAVDVKEATLLAISPDGSRLAVGERSGTVVLVDAARGVVIERLSPPPDDPVPADSLAFSPDGRTLAVGAREQIRLWAIDGKPRPVVRLPGHRGSVRSLAFDAKGVRLAGADEKTIKVWDLAPLRLELARLGLDW